MTTPTIPRTFCITMADSTRWQQTQEHFTAAGLTYEPFAAFDGPRSGLRTDWVYEIDHPKSGYKIGSKIIGIALSHISFWRAAAHFPEDYWMVLEDDAELLPGWQEAIATAITTAPTDWDMIYPGSCNCFDKPKEAVAPNLYRVRWPQCTHCYIVRRKALPTLLATNLRIWAPIDIALVMDSFPKLNIYTILPRVVAQRGTDIYP